jgi:phosphoglycolate phosphatase-like HAD superfamily hydrolase
VIFLDLDGTLLDDTERHYQTYLELCHAPDLKAVPIPKHEYWVLRRKGVSWEEILKKSRLFPTKFQHFRDRFEERVETPEMLTHNRLVEGAETFLGKVYTKTPIVLISQRNNAAGLETELHGYGVRKYFVTVLCGGPKRKRKDRPSDRGEQKASLIRQRYKMPPADALYIGDTETDVAVARAFGLTIFLVEGGHRSKEQLMKADPDRIVANLPGSLKYVLEGGRWAR